MTIENQDFTLTQGKDKVLEFTIFQADGVTPQNITGAAFRWALTSDHRNPPIVTKTTGGGGISIINAAAGRLDVTVDGADTSALDGIHKHELEITLSGIVDAASRGDVNIKPSSLT